MSPVTRSITIFWSTPGFASYHRRVPVLWGFTSYHHPQETVPPVFRQGCLSPETDPSPPCVIISPNFSIQVRMVQHNVEMKAIFGCLQRWKTRKFILVLFFRGHCSFWTILYLSIFLCSYFICVCILVVFVFVFRCLFVVAATLAEISMWLRGAGC